MAQWTEDMHFRPCHVPFELFALRAGYAALVGTPLCERAGVQAAQVRREVPRGHPRLGCLAHYVTTDICLVA